MEGEKKKYLRTITILQKPVISVVSLMFNPLLLLPRLSWGGGDAGNAGNTGNIGIKCEQFDLDISIDDQEVIKYNIGYD